MGRELPMFTPPGAAAHAHAAREPITIAMGGGSLPGPAADGSAALRRHPEWIRAWLPSGAGVFSWGGQPGEFIGP